jgi:hypothetical protein
MPQLETAAIDAITNGWEKIDYEKLSGLSAVAPLLSMSEYAGIHSSST